MSSQMNYTAFLAEIEATKTPNTYQSYKTALKHFPKGTKEEIIAYIGSEAKDTSKKTNLIILRRALEYYGKLTPEIRRIVGGYRANIPVQECPTKKDVDTVYWSLRSPRDKAMFGLMAYNGLRRGEVLALDVSDIQPDDTLRLRDTKGKADALVPLHSGRVLEPLTEYLAERGESDNPALFLTKDGKRFVDNGFGRQFQRWLDRCGLGRFHPHSFRRYFANALDRADVPLQQIQVAMRHRSAVTTARYLNIGIDATRAAMERAFA